MRTGSVLEIQLPVRSLHRCRTRHDNNIIAAGELPFVQPVNLAQPAAQTIALDRVTELGADRQTDSVFLRAVSVAVDDQIPVRAGIALCVEPAKDVIEFQSAGKLHGRLLIWRAA